MIDAGDVINICLFKDVFPPLSPPVIDQNDLFYDPSLLIHGLRSAHTDRSSGTPTQIKIIGFFQMQSNRVVDVPDDCEPKFYLFVLCLTSRMDLVKPYTY